ncbi:PAS domain S-box protein, partial [bacterium]|nr:PAS domain S-box protein [bacterium]
MENIYRGYDFMKSTDGNKFIIVGIITSILFWVAESILHIIFLHGTGLLNQIFSPGIHEFWMRVLVIALILVMSYHAKRSFNTVIKHKNIEDCVRIQRDIAIRIGMDENIDETLNACMDAAIEISGMDCGGIYFVDEVTGDFALVYHKGLSEKFVDASKYYPADSENNRMILFGGSQYFNRDELNRVFSDDQKEEELCSLGVVPINSEGRIIAVLNIASHLHKEISNTVRDAIEGVAAQIGNVIDKARKANELIESEKKYRTIVENAHEGIMIVDNDYKITYVNDELCRIFQYDREELLGFDFTEVIDGEGREIVIDRYKRRQAGEDVPNRYEFNVFRK